MKNVVLLLLLIVVCFADRYKTRKENDAIIYF